MFDFIGKKRPGVALFISVLMTLTLSIIALATMARLSESAHTTGKELQDKRLLAYAYSAVNIVNGELRNLIDSTFQFEEAYSLSGNLGGSTTSNDGKFRYFPKDIMSATNASDMPDFAYRAVARKVTKTDYPKLYGLNEDKKTKYGSDSNACYDITVDVREVMYVGASSYVTFKDNSNVIQGKNDFALGKMKTIGLISCFSRDGENEYAEDDD